MSAPTTTKVEPWNRTITPRTLLAVSLVCFLAWVFSVYDYTLFGTLLPVIAKDFGWSDAYAAGINTWVTVGVFLVSLVVGTLLDRFGRKRALIITVIGAAISSGLTGLAAGAVSLVLIRAFSGFGASEEVVNAVYLNEVYAKAKRRGFMYSFVQSGWPVGALVAAGLTAVILPHLGWRWTFVVAMVPAVLVAIAASRLPESPAYAALKEVRRLREAGDDAAAGELARAHGLSDTDHRPSKVRDVFTPELRRHTICLALAWLFNWMAIQVFSVLGTSVLTSAKGFSFDNSLVVLVLANAVGFCGYIFHGWVGDRIGRRTTIIAGWSVGAVVTAAMLLGPDSSAWVMVTYSLSLFFLTGPYAALLFYMGESFPAQVRGMGTNVAHVMGPVGGIAGSALLTVLLSAGTGMRTAALVTGSVFMLLSGVVMLGTRGTGNRTVEVEQEAHA
ncbi:MFS transporter [Kineococcus rhizosphaerae]|uniref:Putative MFS family arabinose efflux permease n=1 Tax=Kineococcus rhizosphaerae TaxID=559628 RepID=A0A2T0R0I8_9ACTN|nr:MFS transporter [Kineococcus rhizosphaerae]PRY12616.1 putative MFS family arabinose efflux permease [Kineococcus rhizosphaerae]